MNVPLPISPTDLVRWMMGKPLQTNPGARRSYSNMGFLTAGRVVEKISGLTFESAAREFLARADITGIQVGGNTLAERRRGEAFYYLHPDPSTHAWLLEGTETKPLDFSISYAHPVTTLDSTGGLIASAIDYARFMAAIDAEASYPDLLSTNSLMTMASAPATARLGWDYADSPNPRSGIWYKTGALFGSSGWGVKGRNGVVFVYLLNTFALGAGADIYNRITARIGNVPWPTNNLFAATLSYDAWRAKHFSTAELADPALSSDQSDPDNDGVPNLSEYAHGLDPRNTNEPPGISANIRLTDSGNVLVLNFRRLLLEHELDYAFEASSDLLNWSLTNPQEVETPALNADGTITASLNVGPLSSNAARFFRLHISRK
jgi:CubicO group peptidase (beta-lactamase class C family)